MTKHSNSPRSTPVTESVSKWKIPHYYRRSSSVSSQLSGAGDTGAASTPSTPNINIMTSPKRVLMEDPKKTKKRSSGKARKNGKKKSGEMVFVNYTVQDSASQSENGVPSSSSTTPTEVGLSPVVTPNDAIAAKKKSSRSRMLKIFGAGRDSSERNGNQNLYSEQNAMSPNVSMLPKNCSSAAKRSYSSFLKYGKFYGSSVSDMQPPLESKDNQDITLEEEIVPKSNNNPKSVRPFVQANSEMFAGSHGGIHLLRRKKAYSEVDVSQYSTKTLPDDQLPIDHHYLEEDGYMAIPSTNICSNRKPMASEPSLIDGNKLSDENDASIAFTKIFTKKRANTGGSMSSLSSSNNNFQHHNFPPHLNANIVATSFNKNLSVNSIPSASNRFSPIRTASPVRPRSATRGSSCQRISRDSSSLQNSFDITEIGAHSGALPGGESFLDTQAGNKNNASFNSRQKRKQDSISDTYRNSINNNAVTPSSSLITPPTFNSGYTVVSSTSASSTPSMLELSNAGQMNNVVHSGVTGFENSNYCNVLDQDSSSEVLNQNNDSDMPTPIDSIPALKSIPRTTVEETEEDANSDTRHLQVAHNNDNFDHMVFVNGSSTESSQVDSLLTSSVFSLPGNNFWGQDQGSYTMNIHGNNVNNGRSDELTKSAPKISTHPNTNNQLGMAEQTCGYQSTQVPDNGDLKMHIEFDFENTNSFFQEKPTKNNNESHKNYESAVLSSTPVNGQASTATSIANISPGTAATLSVEEISTSNPYQRSLRDQYNSSNSKVYSSSASSQANPNPNAGIWKMVNSDLDAIANSCFFNEDPSDLSYT